jgi:hypothetical protein
VEKSDVHQDLEAENAISLQLQNIELNDDISAISQREDLNVCEIEENPNVLGDNIVHKTRTNHRNNPEANSVIASKTINGDKK